ncbi:HutD family protein [Rhodoferax sp.]|uniref:HutD/Ves family protein n=1 Tax=Rhodoferax sp. TaxID=50421 RepID=UPI00374CDD74
MPFHPFDLDSLPATPWKNGGGTTREIVCQPPGAGMDNFDWRISIASITQAGPFSAFPGIDRNIMLLDGAGVRLQAAGIDHRLDTPGQPFAFSGDLALNCTLLGGASTDFNVMVRRSRLRAEVQVLDATSQTAPSGQGLLLSLRGAWHLQSGAHDFHCPTGHGIWWDAASAWQATPLVAHAQLVLVQVHDLNKTGR